MKVLDLLLACCVVLAGSVRVSSQTKIAYTFTPVPTGPISLLHVDLEFQGNGAGESTLTLPTTWAGEHDLYKSIDKLRCTDPDCALAPLADPGRVHLKYRPNRKVRVAYDLMSDWSGALRYPKEHRAVVQEINMIFNGQNGLVYPELAPETEVQASFTWKDLPKGWSVASSFGTQRYHQSFRGRWSEVYDALFATGDFRITRVTRSGERLTLAARGSWVFSDAEAANQIAEIFRVEREFWGERRRESFLVVLAPFDQDRGSWGGDVFTNAMQIYLSRQMSLLTDIKSLFAHEVFHNWNPYRMGRASGESTEWFSEGFTHYYQDRILLHAGLIGVPEYLQRLNRIAADYWNSPLRNWTQKQWLERGSMNQAELHQAEYDLPYSRGAMIALWLDDRLRNDSAGRISLDERMASLVNNKPDTLLTTESLLAMLSRDLRPEEAADLRSFVESGATIPLPRQLPGGCGNLVQAAGSAPRYLLGQEQCSVLRPVR
ncbi:MAG: hypothetical protein WB425_04145 [Terracidiphilus sp.]